MSIPHSDNEAPAVVAGQPSSTERVAILGDGQMALAMADLLTFKGVPTSIWSPFPREAQALARWRQSPRLPAFRLADTVEVGADAGLCATGATLLLNAIPTQYIRPTWTRIRDDLPADAAVVSVAKGIEVETYRRPSEILHDILGPKRPVAALSGPTIAGELVKRQPAVLVAASDDEPLRERVRGLFTSPWTRIYSHPDLLGVELAGACKNVIAIAAGILDGIGFGTNAKSALLARGLVEISRLGVAMGAKAETFFGVAGVGDLATTCFSSEGRNRGFGEAIGRGRQLEDVLSASPSVVEGVPTAKAVVALAAKHGVEMPISQAVFDILFQGVAVKDAIGDLMSRSSGEERIR